MATLSTPIRTRSENAERCLDSRDLRATVWLKSFNHHICILTIRSPYPTSLKSHFTATSTSYSTMYVRQRKTYATICNLPQEQLLHLILSYFLERLAVLAQTLLQSRVSMSPLGLPRAH